MITTEASHQTRVHDELVKAGMTSYGLTRPSSRYLHRVISEDEAILAVAYGRYEAGAGILVGTDQRIIFLDHKIGLTVCDEIDFDVVTGISSTSAGPFSSITLHTRIGDYNLGFVNHVCAKRFIDYIEKYRIRGFGAPLPEKTIFQIALALSPKAKQFLLTHDTAILSTVDRRGSVYGAVVHYMVDEQETIFILTRSETAKARNILGHQQVALTIYDADPPATLKIQGMAALETNQKIKDQVFAQLSKQRTYHDGKKFPPVTALKEGSYTVIAITAATATYDSY